ncbi:hypothetical protein F4778DRAFT_713477 [Xylariomycetidae sp. FL2044]|nr:hypothetical protein F4778DRAFT_713477 [Xylariomycetidae sp. FL2044]
MFNGDRLCYANFQAFAFRDHDNIALHRTRLRRKMASAGQIENLREQISRAVVQQLATADIDWASFEQLANPILRIEAKFEDRWNHSSHQPSPDFTLSQVIDLTGVVTPKSGTPVEAAEKNDGNRERIRGAAVPSGAILPSPINHVEPVPQGIPIDRAETNANAQLGSNEEDHADTSRKAISSLRPTRGEVPVIEDDTQRTMQISNSSFPKRRKVEPVGYALKPSTLDKLIVGIWEQIHGGIVIDPKELLGQYTNGPLLQGASQQAPEDSGLALQQISKGDFGLHSPSFNHTNVFCRKITQASRTCRSIEVIVQARWIELFDSHVEKLRAFDPTISETKHRKSALLEACGDFSWTEKELRNKMAIWRGYKEIKDAGGWAALIFSGMGIYRFCKYRIGFDRESMQRLRSLRPALEVAADTMHPNWRQLLAVVGESPERIYHGHPHSWVVFLDGSAPAPLHTTYLQWDPYFSFRHLEECVVDGQAWGGDDPRWQPGTDAVSRISPKSICETCGKAQSDDPKENDCYCFPSLFGGAKANPSPVQVFRTPHGGRSNGLLALCAFERGAAVGEFVGVVTKGLQDVDVMECGGGGGDAPAYQIHQGRQGNFTRFINHSCNPNAQYQRFTWLDTQRIVLVSKGIEAGAEITVDYSDKYWKGLDKKCLCGEKICRYRRDDR